MPQAVASSAGRTCVMPPPRNSRRTVWCYQATPLRTPSPKSLMSLLGKAVRNISFASVAPFSNANGPKGRGPGHGQFKESMCPCWVRQPAPAPSVLLCRIITSRSRRRRRGHAGRSRVDDSSTAARSPIQVRGMLPSSTPPAVLRERPSWLEMG